MQFYHCGHVYNMLPVALLCAVNLNRSDGNEVVNAFKLQYTPLKTSKSLVRDFRHKHYAVLREDFVVRFGFRVLRSLLPVLLVMFQLCNGAGITGATTGAPVIGCTAKLTAAVRKSPP